MFSWWCNVTKFDYVTMMRCLFGWNAFSTVKTINIYSPIWIDCLPRLCIFHLFEQPKCSLKHMWNRSNFTQKSPFFLVRHTFFFKSALFQTIQQATCLIVIDAFDYVKFRHPQPGSHKLKAVGLHHVGRNPKTARTAASVVYQSRQRRNQTKLSLRPAPKSKCCCCCSFVGRV